MATLVLECNRYLFLDLPSLTYLFNTVMFLSSMQFLQGCQSILPAGYACLNTDFHNLWQVTCVELFHLA